MSKQVSSKPKRAKQQVKPTIDWSGPLLLLGLGMIIASLWFNQLQSQSDARNAALVRSRMFLTSSQLDQRRFSAPVHITIGSLVNKSLLPGSYTNGTWSLDDTLPLYLASAAHPGENGHIIIYGHNTDAVFGPLRQVKPNDQISIQLANGSQRNYSVTEIHTVRTDQVDFLQQTKYELLTLYTCSGPFDRYRLLIQAEPVEATANSLP